MSPAGVRSDRPAARDHGEAMLVSVVYFGPDGTRYEDDFELDVHRVGLTTRIVQGE